MFTEKISAAFQSKQGQKLYDAFVAYVRENDMEEKIASGCAVALSGGADSVFLLCLLWKYCHQQDFPLFAVSVEHGIRGEESKRDFAFAEDFCRQLSIPFMGRTVDVPAYASEKKISMEEAARQIRYSAFNDIISGREDIRCIALAHNATDQVETVLMHLLRGSGTRGLCGMRPIRGPYIRPILFCSSAAIRSFLRDADIPFCVDSTNSDMSYSRNRIRSILPELSQISTSPEESVYRLSRNLLSDEDYLTSIARNAVSGGIADRRVLEELHPSILFRALLLLCEAQKPDFSYSSPSLEAVCRRIHSPGDFAVSLEDGLRFIAKGERCYAERNDTFVEPSSFSLPLSVGKNRIFGFDGSIDLTCQPPSGTPVLSFAIPASLASNKITVRSKLDGDSFVFESHTRKLKKLFCDLHISSEDRQRIPIFTDECGILYVPGFGFRDGISADTESQLWISVYNYTSEPRTSFLIPKRNIRPSVKRMVKKGTD